MLLFMAALFTIARTWKQPRCPSTDEWIKKLWQIYTMEYYSAIKRNIFESGLMRWMNPKPVMQSEVSQKKKDKYYILMHIYRIQKNGTEEFFAGQQWRNRHREQICGPGKKEGEGEMYGQSNMETYTTICKIDSQQKFAVWLRKLKQRLCINLEGEMGREMGGRFKSKGIYVTL